MASKISNLYKHFQADSLLRNSFYLMLNTTVQAAIGFLFWLLCAHLYKPDAVGLATSVISAAGLVSVFGTLGFNNVIVRFLPTSTRKNEQLSTAFILTSIASVAAAGIFLVWAFATRSQIVQTEHVKLLVLIFIVYTVGITISTVSESAFIAYRKTQYIFIKSMLYSILKILLLFTTISIGFLGIISATTVGLLLACILSFFWLFKKFDYKIKFKIDRETINETKQFAIGNYFGTLFGILPSTVLTLIILSRLGPQYAAFFYMPSMIVAVLNVIPSSISQSFFAEVSHDEDGLVRHFKKALKHLFSFLIPVAIAIWLFGGYVLHFFGAQYAAAGTMPLYILTLSSLFGAANYLGDTLLNIKKKSGMYLFMNFFNSLAVVVTAYIVAPHGLLAIAWASVFGQILTAIVYIWMNWKLIAETRKVAA